MCDIRCCDPLRFLPDDAEKAESCINLIILDSDVTRPPLPHIQHGGTETTEFFLGSKFQMPVPCVELRAFSALRVNLNTFDDKRPRPAILNRETGNSGINLHTSHFTIYP